VTSLDDLLAPEGWPYASTPSTGRGDPGRFHALFGRDSLITSLQVLPERPGVARATLRALAALQGRVEDPETDEEPGRIVHEHWPQAPERLRAAGWPVRDGELRYYGSADATPWFLIVLAALDDHELSRELDASWRAAGRWLELALERGGGLLRHGPRRRRGGLKQQGWRDTVDPMKPDTHGGGIVRADGSAPRHPLADADSQAVAVAGMRALARLSGEVRHRRAGERLAALVAERFGPETLAIQGDDSTVKGAGSQLGWLLWADALPPVAAERAAQRLCRSDVLTPWGLRTLSSEHPQFDPTAYHRGSVWPFDSWLGFGGLRAAGREKEAEQVRRGVLDAIEALGEAPELYAVTDDGPARIPFANRVQGWTVGARLALEGRWDGRAEAL
jgi:glycogen debranching enzyme